MNDSNPGSIYALLHWHIRAEPVQGPHDGGAGPDPADFKMRASVSPREISLVLLCVVVFLLPANGIAEVVLHLQSLSCSNSDMNCSIFVGPADVCIHGWTPSNPILESIETALLDVGQEGPIAVLNITWRFLTEASIKYLNGTEVCVREDGVNGAPVCVRYQYHTQFTSQTKGRTLQRWQYSFTGFEVEQNKTYEINVKNLPRHCDRDTNPRKTYLAPGCKETPMKMTFYCIHTGKSWEPEISATMSDAFLHIAFTASNHSRNYTLRVQGHGVNIHRQITQDIAERIEMNITAFKKPLEYAEYTITLKPYFALCGDACDELVKTFSFYPPTPSPPPPLQVKSPIIVILVILIFLMVFLAMALAYYKKGETRCNTPEVKYFPPRSPRKVLIVYSQDHALFRDIVHQFANFLQRNCNVEVVLDLWQVNNIAEVSYLPWLSKYIDDPDVAIIIVCSKGAQAKWQAMCCPSAKIKLKEDSKSPLGDTFTPAMSLIASDFQRGSYGKYLVVYFDDGSSSSKDIPLPLHVAVKYKLMKHSEELFFRIHNMEQHAPGTNYSIPSVSGDYYHTDRRGQELKAALDKFRQWKAEHPHWFEEETSGNHHDAPGEDCEDAGDDGAEGNGLMETRLLYVKPDCTSASYRNVNLQPSVTEAVNMHTVPVGNVCLTAECNIQPPVMLETMNDDAQGQNNSLQLVPSCGCDVSDPHLMVHAVTSNEGPAAMWNPVHQPFQRPDMSNGLLPEAQFVQFPDRVFHQDLVYPEMYHVHADVNLPPQLEDQCLSMFGDGHVGLHDDLRRSHGCSGGDGLRDDDAPLSEDAMKHLMQVMLQRQ
ncbi:interleukin-17 receptor A-like isoform X1 [Lampetra planeri]